MLLPKAEEISRDDFRGEVQISDLRRRHKQVILRVQIDWTKKKIH